MTLADPAPTSQVQSRLRTLRDRLDIVGERTIFLIVTVPLFAIYLATATWSYLLVNDAITNSITAWNIGTHGSVYLEEHEELEQYHGWFAWIVPAGDSVVSKYPPGAPLLAAPIYAIWPDNLTSVTAPAEDIPERFRVEGVDEVTFYLPRVAPAAITASLSTAAAIGLLAVVFLRLGGSATMSLAGALVAGLGTSAWSVASGQLWQHGPAMLWIALAMLLSDRNMFGSGLAFGAAILTRPPLALIAALTGLYRSIKEKSPRPAVLVGAGAFIGLLAFVGYNWWVFDSPSISAGYGRGFQDNVLSGSDYPYLRALFDAAFSQNVGFFVWSPFLLVLLPGIRAGWRAAPPWARGAFLGGIVYLLVQYKANRASGGTFLGYRYPLDAMVAAAPVLFLSYKEWVDDRPPLRRLFLIAAVVSLVVHGLASIDIGLI